MRKSHVLVLAVVTAVGAMLGAYALTKTTALGVEARAASTKDVDVTVATRTRQLNALEISLRKALAKKPPKLPALPPKVKASPLQSAPRTYASAPVTASAPAPVRRVTASAPVVRRVKRAPAPAPAHEREDEHEDSTSSSGERDD